MDDDLLLGGAIDQPANDFAAEFEDALLASQETAAAVGGRRRDDLDGEEEDGAAAADDGGADVAMLSDGRPITALSKKEAKAQLDKKEYKAWKKAMKALGGGEGEGSDNEGEDEDKSKKDKKKDKSDKKEKKDKKKDKESSSSSKKDKKKSKRDRNHDDDDFAAEVEGLAGDAEELDKAKRRRREKVVARMAKMDADGGAEDHGAYDENGYYAAAAADSSTRMPTSGRGGKRGSQAATLAAHNAASKRLSKEERERQSYSNAFSLVQKMAEARKYDTTFLLNQKKASSSSSSSSKTQQQQLPPIQRVLMKDEVLEFGRKVDNEVPLVKAGFLAEISHWIYDGATKELAPLDLRNTAYELLLKFGFRGSMEATGHNRTPIDREDLNAWLGIGREELQSTTLGKAVNISRQHQSETSQNRQRAVTLLQRLSKAFSNDDSDDESEDEGDRGRKSGSKKKGGASGGAAVHWSCENDPTIATPFEYIANATEVFQNKVVQVDPLDPQSYLRVPPLRIRKTQLR